jgi:hypothetical protein
MDRRTKICSQYRRLYLVNNLTAKRVGGMAQVVQQGPEFKPQYHQKKKKACRVAISM